MQLLNFEDKLTLVFAEEERFSGQFLCEGSEEDVLSKHMPTLDGSDHMDNDNDTVLKTDLRRSLNRSKHAVIHHLKWIQEIRRLACRYGLDSLLRQVIIKAIAIERYNEINAYGNEKAVNRAIEQMEKDGKVTPDTDKAALKHSLGLKGRLTIQEIELLAKELLERVVPEIRNRIKAFRRISKLDPKLGEILNTDVSQDIEIEYWDRTKTPPEREKELLESSMSLTTRVEMFSTALQKTHDAVAEELLKKFQDTYTLIYNKLGTMKDIDGSALMSDAKHNGQRVYTATLFALNKVAPLLNISTLEAKQAAEEKARKEADTLAEKQRKEKEKQQKEAEQEKHKQERKLEQLRKRAESNYKAAVQHCILAAPKETVKEVEDELVKHFHRPVKVADALMILEGAPPNSLYTKLINYIRTKLKIPERSKFESDVEGAAAATPDMPKPSPTPAATPAATPATTAPSAAPTAPTAPTAPAAEAPAQNSSIDHEVNELLKGFDDYLGKDK